MRPIRVVLVDDHALFVQGLQRLLAESGSVEVVATGRNGREAIELVERFRPDVVLLDVSMPLISGIEAVAQIKDRVPGTRIVLLTGTDRFDAATLATEVGADALIRKDTDIGQVLDVVLALTA